MNHAIDSISTPHWTNWLGQRSENYIHKFLRITFIDWHSFFYSNAGACRHADEYGEESCRRMPGNNQFLLKEERKTSLRKFHGAHGYEFYLYLQTCNILQRYTVQFNHFSDSIVLIDPLKFFLRYFSDSYGLKNLTSEIFSASGFAS